MSLFCTFGECHCSSSYDHFASECRGGPTVGYVDDVLKETGGDMSLAYTSLRESLRSHDDCNSRQSELIIEIKKLHEAIQGMLAHHEKYAHVAHECGCVSHRKARKLLRESEHHIPD